MAYTNLWDETLPNGTELASSIDNIFRNLKLDIDQRFIDIFNMPSFATDPLRPYDLKMSSVPASNNIKPGAAAFNIRNAADTVSLININTSGTPSLTINTNSSINGTLTTSGKITVSANGIGVTGNSTIAGTLTGLTGLTTSGGLTVSSGGVNITGNSTLAGTLGGLTGLTVASGGASITGNSTINGTLSGISTLTATSLSGTINTAAQPNITSVGTLTGLSLSGALSVSAGGINVIGNSTISGTLSGISTLTATTLAGTLSTAAQPNITSVGTLTNIIISGTISAGGFDHYFGPVNSLLLDLDTPASSIYQGAVLITNATTLTSKGNIAYRSWILNLGGRASDNTSFNSTWDNSFSIGYSAPGVNLGAANVTKLFQVKADGTTVIGGDPGGGETLRVGGFFKTVGITTTGFVASIYNNDGGTATSHGLLVSVVVNNVNKILSLQRNGTMLHEFRADGNALLSQTAGSTIIGGDPGGSQLLRVGGQGRFNGNGITAGIQIDNQVATDQVYLDCTAGGTVLGRLFRPTGGNNLKLSLHSGLTIGLNDLGGSGGALTINGSILATSITFSASTVIATSQNTLGFLGGAIDTRFLNSGGAIANLTINDNGDTSIRGAFTAATGLTISSGNLTISTGSLIFNAGIKYGTSNFVSVSTNKYLIGDSSASYFLATLGFNVASLPAGSASTSGILLMDTQNNRLIYYSGSSRYYLLGTAF